MLGWTDTQEQAKIVTKQLQMMSHIVRRFGQALAILAMTERGAALVLVKTWETDRMANIRNIMNKDYLHRIWGTPSEFIKR